MIPALASALLALAAGSGLVQLVPPPRPSEEVPPVDEAMLQRAGAKANEYVFEHDHSRVGIGFRDRLTLAVFPVQERSGFCTTTARVVGLWAPERNLPPTAVISRRLVFVERPNSNGCAEKMKGETFHTDDVALPHLSAALALLEKRGFGPLETSPTCPAESSPIQPASLHVFDAFVNRGKLEIELGTGTSDWMVTATFQLGPKGPVLESSTVDCLDPPTPILMPPPPPPPPVK